MLKSAKMPRVSFLLVGVECLPGQYPRLNREDHPETAN